MRSVIRRTRSLCPVCLEPIEASLIRDDATVYLRKVCPRHGEFAVPVWRDCLPMDEWCEGAAELPEGQGLNCPANCGICDEHEQGSCCVLLETTSRCNLRCGFCFARGGESRREPSLEELKGAVSDIAVQAGKPLLQLSGGEPTLRDDLPELVSYARESGCQFVQLNSNGIRLAEDKDYVRRLADAGLSFVFMQFDAAADGANRVLRGRPLLETKLRAIDNCGAYRLGVTLVPTVVKGINDTGLGDIVRLAASLSPAVRGVHFQPVAFIGRYPRGSELDRRYTLDELARDLCAQTGLDIGCLKPSRCDHPMCGFHGAFVVKEGGFLEPIPAAGPLEHSRTTAAQNRRYIGQRWFRGGATDTKGEFHAAPRCDCAGDGAPDMDSFLRRLRERSFTLTAMAFQDALSLDIERLRRCSLHVYDGGKLKPFCARYLSALGT